MAEPINHNFESKASTAVWETGKGAVLGVIGAALLFGVGAVLTGGLVGALLPDIAVGLFSQGAVATFGTGVSFMLSGIGGYITAATALIGGVTFGAEGALVGGVLGLAKAGNKISREKSAYERALGRQVDAKAMEANNYALAGMQQGYLQGFQEGQNKVVGDLQAMHGEMLRQQVMGPAQEKHRSIINQQREVAAAAGTQICG